MSLNCLKWTQSLMIPFSTFIELHELQREKLITILTFSWPAWFSWQSFRSSFCCGVTYQWPWSSSYPLSRVSQILGFGIINIVLLGNLVQSIDAWITSFESLGQLCTRTHKLVPRPVKFDLGLAQPFLNIGTTPSLMVLARMGLRSCHDRVVDFFSVFFLSRSLPNHS